MSKIKATNHEAPIQNNMFGVLYMMVHVFALAVLYAAVKGLTQELSSNLVVFLYKVTIVVCIIPWCFHKGLASMKTKRIGMHIARGVLSITAQLCIFYGLKHLKLLDVSAVQFLEHVIVLTIGILYFKERATKSKFAAIMLSFIGALIIVRPDLFDPQTLASGDTFGFNPYFIFVFMALILYATNNTLIKILGQTEKTKVQLFYTMVVSCIISFPMALMEWHTVFTLGPIDIGYPYELVDFASLNLRPEHFGVIMLLAFCYFMHGITHFKAFKHADISVIIPFEYTRLIFAGLFGWYYFGEQLTLYKFIGYALITGAGLYLLYAENRRLRRARAKIDLAEDVGR